MGRRSETERADGAAAIPADATRASALRIARTTLAGAGLVSPALDARLLAAHALGLAPVAFVTDPDARLDRDGAARLGRALARRLAGEPVQRILGEAEFRGLPFRLAPATLVPRPDTEAVVEAALSALAHSPGPSRVLDLGTGSGCILVAVLTERPDAWGLGLDLSAEAARVAAGNARRNGVGHRAAFAVSDWSEAVGGRWDLVVSNPPYIASPVLATLDPEVRLHDPARALDGGPDGLDAYRRIFAAAPRLLAPTGRLVVEIGFDQSESVPDLARGLGLDLVDTTCDLGGHRRALAFRAIREPA